MSYPILPESIIRTDSGMAGKGRKKVTVGKSTDTLSHGWQQSCGGGRSGEKHLKVFRDSTLINSQERTMGNSNYSFQDSVFI